MTPTLLSIALRFFKDNMVNFCKAHPGIHSVWICTDHNHKDITILTVTNNWDFDLEGEIFSGPYSYLPVETADGYYIEQRVTFMNGGNVEDVLSSGFKQIHLTDRP